jgi:two-component system OmpR family response regulator
LVLALFAGGPAMRILVIDDNDLLAEALIAGLADRGHLVSRALNEEVALGDALAAEIQAVVIDWQMPGMRGDEVAARVRTLRPQAAIILMSGDSTGKDIQDACRTGGAADDLIQKPFTPNQLLSVIERALNRSQMGAGA